MKYSGIALAAFVAVASAANINDIPSCAVPCIEDAVTKETKCTVEDYLCICNNMGDVANAATNCVLAKCGTDVAFQKVLPATENFCQEVEEEGGAAPASSASPESSAPAPTPAPPAPSAAPEPSSAAPSVYPTSVVPSAAPSSAEPSSTATSTPPAVTAGAAQVAGSLGLLVLGAVAAI